MQSEHLNFAHINISRLVQADTLWHLNRLMSYHIAKSHNSSYHSRSQRPRFFWSAPRIATSGKIQFQSMRKVSVLYSQPIRFVRLESEHAQSDGKSVNRGLSVLDLPRSRISCCWPKGARPLRRRIQALTRSFEWLFITNLIIPTRSHMYSLILRSFESTKKNRSYN